MNFSRNKVKQKVDVAEISDDCFVVYNIKTIEVIEGSKYSTYEGCINFIKAYSNLYRFKSKAMKATKENNHPDLVDQTFRDELGDGCRNFARFLLTFIVISILGAGILILLIIFNA